MVGQREAHHQVRYSQVEHELVGDERGQPPAQRHGEDSERVPAHDEHHERSVDDAPRPVVVQVRTLPLLGRVPPLHTLIPKCKVHTIAGRGRQRPPLRKVRRRGNSHAHFNYSRHLSLALVPCSNYRLKSCGFCNFRTFSISLNVDQFCNKNNF
jgi:hypothetical protein